MWHRPLDKATCTVQLLDLEEACKASLWWLEPAASSLALDRPYGGFFRGLGCFHSSSHCDGCRRCRVTIGEQCRNQYGKWMIAQVSY